MTTLAAVDCSTNSLRLLISRVEVVDGVLEITELYRLIEIVRLGQEVDTIGMLAPETLERVREVLMRYVEFMQVEETQVVWMVATSATCGAGNRDDFLAMTREILASWGAEAEVIIGEEEAALSFRGAVDDLEPEFGPYCVIDVGGGSIEATVGDRDDMVVGSDPVAIGSVRLTECLLQSSSPTAEQVQKARSYVAEPTDGIVRQVFANEARTIVGCAGTFTTLPALVQGLETYDPEAIHLSQLCFMALCALTASAAEVDAESLAANPVMYPKRANAFAGGSIIVDGPMDMPETLSLSEAAEEEQRFFYISEKDILDGIVVSLIDTHIAR